MGRSAGVVRKISCIFCYGGGFDNKIANITAAPIVIRITYTAYPISSAVPKSIPGVLHITFQAIPFARIYLEIPEKLINISVQLHTHPISLNTKKFLVNSKIMEKIYYYRVEGIKGEGKSAVLKEDGLTPLDTSAPPEFGGIAGKWTPEHLFVASVVSCYIMTFISVAAAMRIEFEEMKCEGIGTLKPTEGTKMEFVEVILKPTVVVRSEQLKEKTLKAIKVTHDHCLVARSLKSEVKVEPSVIIK